MVKYRVPNAGNPPLYVDLSKMDVLAWDGVLNQNGVTRSESLYVTRKSNRFFKLHESVWQGESDWIEEVTKEDAYEFLMEHAGDVDAANAIIPIRFQDMPLIQELE